MYFTAAIILSMCVFYRNISPTLLLVTVVGASTNPQSDTYAGTGPFSEPETLDLSNFISSIGDRIDIYLSFHSFGQLLLIPFGNSTAPYANYHDNVSSVLFLVAKRCQKS